MIGNDFSVQTLYHADMKIDPRQLMQLSAVVETGGLTEAAALLGTSQPAISRMLSALEARLGQPVVLRDRRPLQPTALGRALAEQGDAIRLAARRSGEAADALRRGERGTVRLGGTPFFTDALISGMIAEFHRAHPSVRVDQRYGYTGELKALVKSGQLDLAICPVELLGEGDEDLTFQELLPGRNVVACRVGHPLLQVRPLRAEALLEHPWIEPPPGSPLIADLRTALLALGATHVCRGVRRRLPGEPNQPLEGNRQPDNPAPQRGLRRAEGRGDNRPAAPPGTPAARARGAALGREPGPGERDPLRGACRCRLSGVAHADPQARAGHSALNEGRYGALLRLEVQILTIAMR